MNNHNKMYRAMNKKELAKAAGVSHETFRLWLRMCENILIPMGYKRTSRILTPKMVQFLCKEYGIFIE